jgi:hypothetical protein
LTDVVGPARDVRLGEGVDDVVGAGRGQVVV